MKAGCGRGTGSAPGLLRAKPSHRRPPWCRSPACSPPWKKSPTRAAARASATASLTCCCSRAGGPGRGDLLPPRPPVHGRASRAAQRHLRRPLPPRPRRQHAARPVPRARPGRDRGRLPPPCRAARSATPAPGRRVIALDGKTLRGSFDHLDDRAAAQVLSAFAGEDALILAHQEIAEGDEIAAAQALIEQLGLRGVLFTADALHCQKNLRRHGRDRQRAAGAREGQPAAPA